MMTRILTWIGLTGAEYAMNLFCISKMVIMNLSSRPFDISAEFLVQAGDSLVTTTK